MTQGKVIANASNSTTIRLRIDSRSGALARVVTLLGEMGVGLGAFDTVRVESDGLLQDITVFASGEELFKVTEAIKELEGVELVNVSDRTFLMHLGGKIEVRSKQRVKTRDQLSMAYTPGVARVCTAIHESPEKVYQLTIKRNTVAVVSDGTAVLGLGDIGPEAALPVMEGKAQLFKDFGGVDAFPLCLDTTDVDRFVDTVKAVAPVFGGINLEDIAAPRCFEIERRLKEELPIPVFHDDQHGTAVVLVAALLNALQVVSKRIEDLKIVLVGVGAAGTACTRMLLDAGAKNIIGCDRKGAVTRAREDLTPAKAEYAALTNPEQEAGSVHDVIRGADVFIGLSGPGLLDESDLKNMAPEPIVFAMANPTPEIMPEVAYPHVAVMATGRSDYPNQINNVLCFPGIFKGALACYATDINEDMKMAAAHAIAATIPPDSVSPDYIIPSVFDREVVDRVAEAVEAAARESGVAGKHKG